MACLYETLKIQNLQPIPAIFTPPTILGKLVKNIQIDTQTTETWSIMLNVTL